MQIRTSGSFAALALAAGAILLGASQARADFSGQTILGPLTLNSSVDGDNTGASNDNDGWFSGDHIFDLWNGGDDVYQLDWAGGDLMLTMTYDNSGRVDPDLFLYVPGSLNESSYDSYTNTGLEKIIVPGAAAGTYYVLVDSAAGTEGAYTLNVVPAPAAGMLAGLGMCLAARRRRN